MPVGDFRERTAFHDRHCVLEVGARRVPRKRKRPVFFRITRHRLRHGRIARTVGLGSFGGCGIFGGFPNFNGFCGFRAFVRICLVGLASRTVRLGHVERLRVRRPRGNLCSGFCGRDRLGHVRKKETDGSAFGFAFDGGAARALLRGGRLAFLREALGLQFFERAVIPRNRHLFAEEVSRKVVRRSGFLLGHVDIPQTSVSARSP